MCAQSTHGTVTSMWYFSASHFFQYPPVDAKSAEVDLKRRFWRYQRGNQIPYNEEEQTAQWPKEKVQKDKQRSTKHTYKTKDRNII